MNQARLQIGESKWDTARGAIAGVIVAVVLLSLTFGMANLEDLSWPIFAIPVCIGGIGGFFFGKNRDQKHLENLRNKAFEIDSREGRN